MTEEYFAHSKYEHRYGVVSRAGGRELNEDACAVRDYSLRRNPKYLSFMALADGMGGHQSGDVASQVAIEMLESLAGAKRFADSDDFEANVEKVLWSAFSNINSHIFDLGQTSAERRGMGTTLTCALIDSQHAHIAHVGDSRAYLISSEGIKQLTEDHSVVGKMVSDGVISEQEGLAHENRNVLTRAIGPEPNVGIDISTVALQEGETLLICSDGLYTVVLREEIGNVVLTEADLQTACERLVGLAIARGSDDNVSAIAWRMPVERGLATRKAGSKRGRTRNDLRVTPLVLLIIALITVAIGFGIGWGVGVALRGDKTSTGRESAEGEKPVDTSPGNNEETADGIAEGMRVKIQLADIESTYTLRSEPDTTSRPVADLKNGCTLEVTAVGEKDAQGNKWCRVTVLDSGPDKGKLGWARSDFLEEVEGGSGG